MHPNMGFHAEVRTEFVSNRLMPVPGSLTQSPLQSRLDELEQQFMHAPVKYEELIYDLMRQASEMGDLEAEVRAAILYGGALFYQGRFPEVLDYTTRALKMARDLHHEALESRVLNGLGITEQRLGLYGQAFQHYHQSLALSRRLGDLAGRVRTLDNLASLHRIFRQFDRAMTYLAEAQELLLRYRHPVYTFTVSGNLIWTHIEAGNYQQAMAIIHLLLPEAQEQQATQFIVNYLSAQARCYLHLGRLPQAQCCAEQAVKLVQTHQSIDPDGISFSMLGQVKLALRHFDQAEKYLLLALDVAEESGSARARADGRAHLADFYEQTGNAERVYLHDLQFFQMQEQVPSGAMQPLAVLQVSNR